MGKRFRETRRFADADHAYRDESTCVQLVWGDWKKP